MRLLFLILLLANVVMFAYITLVREQPGPAAQLSTLQIRPEKIQLIRDAGPQSKARPAVIPAQQQAAGACIEWGVLAGPDAVRAEAALATLNLPQSAQQRTLGDGGYWVFIPPLKTRPEVDKKVSELKALGVTDWFVVQEPAQWRNAISLGIFKTEDSAKTYLAGLRQTGVRSAVVERRENLLRQIAFFVRDPSEATVARLTELQRSFPGTELRAGPCPG
jgi:hypothetical protein